VGHRDCHCVADITTSPRPFSFVSVFKWEHRKGWDVLVSAFFKEFRAEDNVRAGAAC
jgi:hypothetical protein